MYIAGIYEFIKQLDFGDIPTWLGSIGTVGTLVYTLRQLNINKNEKKEYELRLQAKDISSWIVGDDEKEITINVNNSSSTPVYSIIITIVAIQGAGMPKDGREMTESYKHRSRFAILPPGKFQTKMPHIGRGMHIEFGIEIAFTDSMGNSWVRKSNGKLVNIKQSTLEYYNTPRPISWSSFEEIK